MKKICNINKFGETNPKVVRGGGCWYMLPIFKILKLSNRASNNLIPVSGELKMNKKIIAKPLKFVYAMQQLINKY